MPNFYFLKVGLQSANRIHGDSKKADFPGGWIDVVGFGPVHGPASPGTGPGKSRVSEFWFTKATDKSSQRILNAWHAGEPFDAAVLWIEGPDRPPRFVFEDVLIGDCQVRPQGDMFTLKFKDLHIVAAEEPSTAAIVGPRGRSAQAASTLAVAVASSLAPSSAPIELGVLHDRTRRA